MNIISLSLKGLTIPVFHSLVNSCKKGLGMCMHCMHAWCTSQCFTVNSASEDTSVLQQHLLSCFQTHLSCMQLSLFRFSLASAMLESSCVAGSSCVASVLIMHWTSQQSTHTGAHELLACFLEVMHAMSPASQRVNFPWFSQMCLCISHQDHVPERHSQHLSQTQPSLCQCMSPNHLSSVSLFAKTFVANASFCSNDKGGFIPPLPP